MSTPNTSQAADTADVSTGGPVGNEPVLISHMVTVVLGAAVTAGWLSIPSTMIDTIATVAGIVLSTLGAFAARGRVSPSGKITWQGVLEEIQGTVYEELDRILALIPGQHPAPPETPPASTPAPASPPPSPAAAPPPKPQMPVGTFTAATPFAPQPKPDPSPTLIQPAVPPAP